MPIKKLQSAAEISLRAGRLARELEMLLRREHHEAAIIAAGIALGRLIAEEKIDETLGSVNGIARAASWTKQWE